MHAYLHIHTHTHTHTHTVACTVRHPHTRTQRHTHTQYTIKAGRNLVPSNFSKGYIPLEMDNNSLFQMPLSALGIKVSSLFLGILQVQLFVVMVKAIN